jgi:2,3-bisphosphoglycerate-dependent phosphoglycerate mutase
MTTLIIARHGNTFAPGDVVTYVGARTDLPLVESGREQARAIGRYLKENGFIPDVVYASALRRAQETAKIAVMETGVSNPIFTLDILNEIDYGPDENKTRDDVVARIGEQALNDWDERGIVPEGWSADTAMIQNNWMGFVRSIVPPHKSFPPHPYPLPDGERESEPKARTGEGEIHLVVTSNGIARFAPCITGDYEGFLQLHSPKLATGAMGVLVHNGHGWAIKSWNFRP